MNIQNKVVVITGAGRGLGSALVKAFSKNGARVIASGKNKQELKNQKMACKIHAADVTKEPEIKKLTNWVVKKFKKIDIWINNAGIWMPHAPIEKMNLNLVHKLIEVNLFGTIHGSKAALIQMKKQKFGTIINILSTSALEGRPNSSGYCASKFAATGFTKSLRAETKNPKINIVAVYPGGMKTHLFDKKKPKEFADFMNPEDVAKRILKNLSQKNPEKELILK